MSGISFIMWSSILTHRSSDDPHRMALPLGLCQRLSGEMFSLPHDTGPVIAPHACAKYFAVNNGRDFLNFASMDFISMSYPMILGVPEAGFTPLVSLLPAKASVALESHNLR
eukprot:jgi/Botrbrau1/31/Bobra.0022s0026.1